MNTDNCLRCRRRELSHSVLDWFQSFLFLLIILIQTHQIIGARLKNQSVYQCLSLRLKQSDDYCFVKDIDVWTSSNFLNFNESKTEVNISSPVVLWRCACQSEFSTFGCMRWRCDDGQELLSVTSVNTTCLSGFRDPLLLFIAHCCCSQSVGGSNYPCTAIDLNQRTVKKKITYIISTSGIIQRSWPQWLLHLLMGNRNWIKEKDSNKQLPPAATPPQRKW